MGQGRGTCYGKYFLESFGLTAMPVLNHEVKSLRIRATSCFEILRR